MKHDLEFSLEFVYPIDPHDLPPRDEGWTPVEIAEHTENRMKVDPDFATRVLRSAMESSNGSRVIVAVEPKADDNESEQEPDEEERASDHWDFRDAWLPSTQEQPRKS